MTQLCAILNDYAAPIVNDVSDYNVMTEDGLKEVPLQECTRHSLDIIRELACGFSDAPFARVEIGDLDSHAVQVQKCADKLDKLFREEMPE
jgi:hypothetical protein